MLEGVFQGIGIKRVVKGRRQYGQVVPGPIEQALSVVSTLHPDPRVQLIRRYVWPTITVVTVKQPPACTFQCPQHCGVGDDKRVH